MSTRHKHPEGALCAAGGFYPPLQLRQQSRRRVDILVDPYRTVLNSSRSALSGDTAARADDIHPCESV